MNNCMKEFDNLDNRKISRNTQAIKMNSRRNRKSRQIYNKKMKLSKYSKHFNFYNPSSHPSLSNVEVLTVNMTVFGDRVFKKAARLKRS